MKIPQQEPPQVSPRTQLSEWTQEWIKAVLDHRLGEGLYLEFKSGLDSKDPEHQENIRKALVSFANTSGGFIVFGINDPQQKREMLLGVQDTNEFTKKLTDLVTSKHVLPSVLFEGPRIIPFTKDGKEYKIVVIKVVESKMKPVAILKGDQLYFWQRSNGTARWVSYPDLISMVETSSELRGWIAAMRSDMEYIEKITNKIVSFDWEKEVLGTTIRTFINSEQSFSIVIKFPSDVNLILLIRELRENVDAINHHFEMIRAQTGLSNLIDSLRIYKTPLLDMLKPTQELAQKIKNHIDQNYPYQQKTLEER